jgi:hypothetical protein
LQVFCFLSKELCWKLAAGPISKAALDAEHWLLEGAQMAELSVTSIFCYSPHCLKFNAAEEYNSNEMLF